MDFTNPLVYGVPCFLGLILLELTYSKNTAKKELYKWGEGLKPGQIPEGDLGREKKWFGHYLHFEQ